MEHNTTNAIFVVQKKENIFKMAEDNEPLFYVTKKNIRNGIYILISYVFLSILSGVYHANGFYGLGRLYFDVSFAFFAFVCYQLFVLLITLFFRKIEKKENDTNNI